MDYIPTKTDTVYAYALELKRFLSKEGFDVEEVHKFGEHNGFYGLKVRRGRVSCFKSFFIHKRMVSINLSCIGENDLTNRLMKGIELDTVNPCTARRELVSYLSNQTSIKVCINSGNYDKILANLISILN